MSHASSLYVTDRKGIHVSGWKRGQEFIFKAGESIPLNSSGVAIYKGVILNLSAEVREKLVRSQRVVVKG